MTTQLMQEYATASEAFLREQFRLFKKRGKITEKELDHVEELRQAAIKAHKAWIDSERGENDDR